MLTNSIASYFSFKLYLLCQPFSSQWCLSVCERGRFHDLVILLLVSWSRWCQGSSWIPPQKCGILTAQQPVMQVSNNIYTWNALYIFFFKSLLHMLCCCYTLSNFLCWLLLQYLFHLYVTAAVCKRSWSFCQKCRWQVTAKHTCTLCMWLWIKWL